MTDETEPVAEDQQTDSDAASSSAAKVDVHVDGNPNDNGRPSFDATVSDNLIAMLITQAQQDLALNMATARNLVANTGAALTMGVQQINAAALIQLTKMSPLEAQALGLLPQNQTPPQQ